MGSNPTGPTTTDAWDVGSEAQRVPPSWRRWEDLEPKVKGKILQVLMAHRNRLTERTLAHYSQVLMGLAEMGDLNDVSLIES